MQGLPVTLPPWLSPWSSGLLYGQRVYKGTLRERYRPRDRHRPRLTIYTYNHDDSHNILRLGGWNGADSSGTARPVSWERYGGERGDRGDREWRLAVPAHPRPDLYREIHIKAADPPADPPAAVGAGAAGGGAGGAAGGGWGAARGWAAGTALLALLVVLARAAETCIDRKFFKRRRRSEEWPAASVRATSQQQSMGDLPPGIDLDSLPPTVTVDLPPPYSECTRVATSPKDYPEEPPPPYSDCYVEFSNKNGIPSVLIFSRRRNSVLNRHEIVGSRDEATTSDGQIDDAGVVTLEDIRDVVTLEDIRVENRERDVRCEVPPNVECNDQTAQSSAESVPSTDVTVNVDVRIDIVSEATVEPNTTTTDTNVRNIPEVATVIVNTNRISDDNVKVV